MSRERRRYNRLVLSLPVKYSSQREQEDCSLGVLKNISLGGLYFECPPPTALEAGQVLHLSIAATLPSLDLQDTSHLSARGEVVRLDQPRISGRTCGVAIRFLDELNFSAAQA
ncbi:MAG: PilZ domain-containing protein [Desulfobaccales bacterium]